MSMCSTVKAAVLPDVLDAERVAATREGIPPDDVVVEAVDVLKALASPVRMRIVHALAHGELCVGDLAQAFGLSMSVVSHQLGYLRRLKLVAARDEGRQTYYRVVSEFVGELVHDCLAHVSQSRPAAIRHQHPHRKITTGRTRR
jgi:ArsR family transcriptional regulator, lead/cadmium/zinc/bismuth-responsive transcriptional repressor